MTELPEDRVFARHRRRLGAVLIIGAGAVGGFLAEELARMGFSPVTLVDLDMLEVENLIRHPLGAQALGQPKASALASKIRRDFPVCEADGLDVDFLALPQGKQRELVRAADVVVAATDNFDCQLRVNRVALAEERPAVYPAVWVDERIRDAEVGEILWVLPGRHTPCYECATATRQGAPDAEAARGARADIQQVSLAAARVVAALLDPTDEQSAILDPERTAIYLHGLTPTSRGIRNIFATEGLQSRNVQIRFPSTPCPACGGQDPIAAAADWPRPTVDPLVEAARRAHMAVAAARRPAPPSDEDVAADDRWERRTTRIAACGAVCIAILAIVLGLALHDLHLPLLGGHTTSPPATSAVASPPPARPSQAQPAAANPAQATPPTQTQLICNVSQTSSYAAGGSDCISGDMYSGDTIVLEVSGFTQSVVRALCEQGYQDEWSTSTGSSGSATGMCAELSAGMGFASDGNLVASFSNPGVLGPDTVTWSLVNPSGGVALQAQYSFNVLETLYGNYSTPTS